MFQLQGVVKERIPLLRTYTGWVHDDFWPTCVLVVWFRLIGNNVDSLLCLLGWAHKIMPVLNIALCWRQVGTRERRAVLVWSFITTKPYKKSKNESCTKEDKRARNLYKLQMFWFWNWVVKVHRIVRLLCYRCSASYNAERRIWLNNCWGSRVLQYTVYAR